MSAAAQTIPKYDEFMKNTTLIRDKAYIDGKWVQSQDGASFDVRNPATGQLISQVADCGAAETQNAM